MRYPCASSYSDVRVSVEIFIKITKGMQKHRGTQRDMPRR